MDQLVAMIFIIGGVSSFLAVILFFAIKEELSKDEIETEEIEVQNR